jgi:hypothetical protein
MSAKGFPRGQLLFGVLIVFAATLSLLRAGFALAHHTDVEMWVGRVGHNRMNPGQAFLVFGLCLAFGLFLLIDALRKRRK